MLPTTGNASGAGNRTKIVGTVLAAVLAASLLFPIGLASHPQRIFADSAAPTIKFDYWGGNEWWLEVSVSTSDPEYHVDRVEATDDGVTWHQLTLRDWGTWAASFHIEPGHYVQLRAAQHGGMSDAWLKHSCWFEHDPPTDVERCGTYDATFRDAKGNEWWQEVYVSAPAGVSKVDVSVNGGTFQPLTKRSWGAWAGSYRAPGGSTVEFRATSPSGATDLSGCYYWTLGGRVECNRVAFDVSFRNIRGNQYWIESDVVVLKGTLSTVEYVVRTNTAGVCPHFDPNTNSYSCDPKPMSKTSWGSYAANANVPPDSVVGFKATSTAGDTDRGEEWRWPPVR